MEPEKQRTQEFYKIIRDNKLVYALTTFERAIPNYRDGLKIVLRRILFSMQNDGLHYKAKHCKSAKVVGNVMGSYHPHGDSSIYGAMVTMAQEFTKNYPLIDGQGNWGNVFGDPAAAYRYTECRLSKFFCDISDELSQNYMNYIPNYDNSTQIAEYLSFKIPLLLINGSYGISESYICSIPPHNLADTVDICKKYIFDKTIPNEILVDGYFPDFPNYGIITNKSEIERFYKYGEKGNVKQKATMEIDRINNRIFIKDLPFDTTVENITTTIRAKNKAKHAVMSKILDFIDNKVVVDGEERIEYEVIFDKNANILEIARDLEKFCTSKTIPLNFILSYDDHVKVVTIKDIIEEWYKVRKSTISRKINYHLSVMRNKIHVLKGLLTIYDYLDEILRYIKTSSSKEDIINYLSKQYGLSNTQAKAITEIPLYKLSKVSKDTLINEIGTMESQIEEKENQLFNIDNIIIQELDELKRMYGRPRRTKIFDEVENGERTSIIISNGALLRSYNQYSVFDIQNIIHGKTLLNGLKPYRIDGKNVKEICGFQNIRTDIIGLIVFVDNGMAKRIEVSEIIDTNNWIVSDIGDATILDIVPIYNEDDELIIVSNQSKIKRIRCSDINKQFVSVGDINKIEVVDPAKEYVLIVTDTGYYHFIKTEDIPLLGRTGQGVILNSKSNNISIKQIDKNNPGETIIFSVIDDIQNEYFVMRMDVSNLNETNRANNMKIFVSLDSELKITNLNTIDIKLKDSKCVLIGKYGSIQLSTNYFKSNELSILPKKVSINTLGIVQYTL